MADAPRMGRVRLLAGLPVASGALHIHSFQKPGLLGCMRGVQCFRSHCFALLCNDYLSATDFCRYNYFTFYCLRKSVKKSCVQGFPVVQCSPHLDPTRFQSYTQSRCGSRRAQGTAGTKVWHVRLASH